MIELESVGKRFVTAPRPGRGARAVEALREVTLRLEAGRVCAVVGPNGAGKTTLFAILLGFLRPTAGAVAIEGLEPQRYVRRNGAGYLPERFQLPGEWSTRATLRSLARLEGLRPGEAAAAADQWLERMELAEHADKPLRALSRGLLQRVGIAQALLGRRALVVLDEPTEGLDPLWRIRFRALVEELRSEGCTLLMASHDLAEVERLADRAVVLEDGRVRDELEIGPVPGAEQRYRLELAEPTPAIAEIFPGAQPAEGAAPAYVVTVSGAAELSARVAALLAAGGLLVSMQPAAEALEQRVRRALEADDA